MYVSFLNCHLWRHGLVLFLLFTGYFLAQAQSTNLTQTIKGVIIDQASEEPLPGANILVVGTDPALGTATELDGSFRLDGVPLGRHTLRISSIGYEDAYMQELEVASGKEIILTIRLTESLIALNEVVVSAERLSGTPDNEMATVSARSFSVEQTKRYAAAVNDPARMAMSFAGVSTQDDGGNEIVIRGNSPRSLLWRMEGIEIPSPNHFSDLGASGGGVSALSVNVLANSDFLVSAFPAEYGNALSGVFDLKLRNGNAEKREYALQAGVLGLDIAAEGPINKAQGSSYLFNYRYSTLSILGELGIIDLGGGITSFQDAAFKVNFPTAKNGYWSVWGMGGLSKDVENTDEYEFDFFSNRGVFGINNRTYFKKNDYLESIISYAVNTVGEEGTQFSDNFQEESSFTENSLRFSLLYNRKFSARATFRTGAIFSNLGYNFQDWEKEADAPRTTLIDTDGRATYLQAYAQWKYRVGTGLHLNAGLHGSYLGIDGQYTLEPRVGLRWNYRPGHAITAGAGLHSRLDPLPLYLSNVIAATGETSQANKGLDISKALHAVVGYEWRFHPEWRLQAEAYYQHLYHVPIAASTATADYSGMLSAINFDSGYITDSLVSTGTGRNVGVDVTVERFFTRGWYALATASVYQSTYTGADGVERSTRFDARYVANVLLGKEWTVGRRDVNQIGLSLRLNAAGGNRQHPLLLEASIAEGHSVYDYSKPWSWQNTAYFRPDIRFSYRINKTKTSAVISLDIQNAANRENVYNQYYDADLGQITTSTQLGLIPIFNYRLEF